MRSLSHDYAALYSKGEENLPIWLSHWLIVTFNWFKVDFSGELYQIICIIKKRISRSEMPSSWLWKSKQLHCEQLMEKGGLWELRLPSCNSNIYSANKVNEFREEPEF